MNFETDIIPSLKTLASDRKVYWNNYFSEYEIENGVISYSPKKESSSEGIESFIDYCTFTHKHGYYFEIGINFSQESVEFHLVSWELEENEPFWSEETEFNMIIRINP